MQYYKISNSNLAAFDTELETFILSIAGQIYGMTILKQYNNWVAYLAYTLE